MGYVYSRENIKRFSFGDFMKMTGMNAASYAVTQTALMIVKQITDSIEKGDIERAFVKFKNNNVFKRMVENAKEKKQFKIDHAVDVNTIHDGMTIRNVVADTEFLIEEVLDRTPKQVTVKYTLTNPEEVGIDKDSIKKAAEVTLTDKDLKFFNKVA